MKNALLLVSIGILFLSGCSKPTKYSYVISNVGFFDGYEDRGIVNLGINNDTISVISKEELSSDSILDGSGKYLIPGLVNSHVHAWKDEHLKEAYNAGVLALMNMHSGSYERDDNMKALSKLEGHSFYYTSGTGATVPGGHPGSVVSGTFETINDTLSVYQWADRRFAEDVDYIKIFRDNRPLRTHMPKLPFDSIKKLVDYTHEKGKKAVVHATTVDEFKTIAKYKPDGFVHDIRVKGYVYEPDLLDEIKSSGAFVCPTATFTVKAYDMYTPKDTLAYNYLIKPSPTPKTIMKNIKLLFDAGITIVAGTDVGGPPYLNWGDDLLYELNIYSKAGLPNLEVLRTATGYAANAWDIPIGVLEVGSKLNMILLNGNPIENLENLKNIEHIWKTE